MKDLRYPIGQFDAPSTCSPNQIADWIGEIEVLPVRLRAAVAGLSADQLDTPYRPDGWTVRQVVHHVPDSHLNSIIRFKWALTEDRPVIKPYDEVGWAKLADYQVAPIDLSLDLLEALHRRWVVMLRALDSSDLVGY